MIELEAVLPMLVCTSCEQRSGLERREEDPDASLICPACGHRFFFRDGILDMLPKKPPVSLVQRAFLTRIYTKAYDIFRHSFLWAMVNWLPAQKERKQLVDSLSLHGDEMLLDLPCGTGYPSETLLEASQGLKIIGCDLSLNMIVAAREKLDRTYGDRFFLIRADAMRLPFKDGSFTRISSVAGLHQYQDPYRSLEEISRIMVESDATFAGWTPCVKDSGVYKLIGRFWNKLLGVNFIDRLRMERKLKEEGFREFTWQPRGFMWACFTASR
jgi:SAM-dependent methyltransferase